MKRLLLLLLLAGCAGVQMTPEGSKVRPVSPNIAATQCQHIGMTQSRTPVIEGGLTGAQ
jgi:hypothetical protein